MNDFERLDDAWNSQQTGYAQCYKIGPFTVAISSNNKMLMDKLTGAFSHIASESGFPDLTIRLWAAPKLPPLDWDSIQWCGSRGYGEPPCYYQYMESIGALSAVDTSRNIAYYVVQDPNDLPWWVSGSPLQTILHVFMREKGMQLTHSAAISNKKSAILLSGKGGSGKSTTILSCLKEGLDTLGEDYILLGGTSAYSVYQTAKWEHHTRTLFPSYEKHIANPKEADQEKALVYYEDLFPSQMAISSPVHASVSLQVGTSLKLEKSDPHTSIQSLLLSTAMQLPHSDPRTTSILQTFLEPLSHYRLTLGPDYKENVALLRSLF